MLLAVVASVMSAGVEVAAEAPCIQASFAQQLASAGVVLPLDATLSLRSARAEVLEVTLTARGAAPMRREVPAGARDCAAVDRVVIALVKAWLASPAMVAPSPRGAEGSDGGRPLDGGALSPGHEGSFVDGGGGASAASRGTDGPVAGRGVGTPLPRSGGVEGSTSPVVDAGAGSSREVSSVDVGAAPGVPTSLRGVEASSLTTNVDAGAVTAPPLVADSAAGAPSGDGGRVEETADGGLRAAPWRIGVGLLGGIASGTTSDVVPQGLLSVDLTRGWFGAALDVGLSGSVTGQVAPGTVTSSWQWLSVSVRALWAPLQRVALEVQLGVRGHRVVAVATGYSETKPQQQLFSIGAVGSIGASVVIIGPVGLTVRATGVLKPPERFTIDNLGPVLDLGSLEGGVHAGVVVRW